jgi:glutaminyl-tRNA synthetase
MPNGELLAIITAKFNSLEDDMSDNENLVDTRANFITKIIDEDLKTAKNGNKVVTRFPPEPNGYLHIGHAKSICLNYGLAQDYAAKGCETKFHLRFDDTNPSKEEQEYIDAIKEDVQWLGADWGENLFHASHYFDKMYDYAVELIKMGKAYVCELNADEMREYRGSLKEPGKDSPYRDRSVEENLDLFEKMKNGNVEEGKMTLRAKIDMASPFIVMRDPVIYRVMKKSHPVTGDKWNIYPMYDYAHCLEDMIEGITHSICTLEFQDNRRFYDWVLDTLKTPCHPQQIEFAQLNIEYTVLSKRFLKQLIDDGLASGWDDPMMPTIKGMRRRGIRPEAISKFADQIGVTKKDSTIAIETFEGIVRDDLGPICPRAFGVVEPLKVVITNWHQGTQEIECAYHPKDESFGTRKVPMTKEIYIEKSDFMEDAPKKFFRLKPEGYVRLKFAYVIKCDEVIKDENGEVVELHCTYFPETFAGVKPEGFPKVKGIINWVSASQGVEIENRLYDRLFTVPNPRSDKEKDFKDFLNPEAKVVTKSYIEPALTSMKVGERVQFERQGYFVVDPDTTDTKMVFNRIMTLKDTWAFKKN